MCGEDEEPEGRRVVTTADHAACDCGWLLPESVVAFPFDQLPAPERIVQRVYTALRCPVCDRAHAFFNGDEPDGLEAQERFRRSMIGKLS